MFRGRKGLYAYVAGFFKTPPQLRQDRRKPAAVDGKGTMWGRNIGSAAEERDEFNHTRGGHRKIAEKLAFLPVDRRRGASAFAGGRSFRGQSQQYCRHPIDTCDFDI